MPYLVVCSLARIAETARAHRPNRMLTVISEATPVPRPAGIGEADHLHLTFNDIGVDTPGLVTPGADHVRAMLAFAEDWNRQAPLLIHCFAGVSRSTAAAYAIALALDASRDAATTANELRFRSPTATPNRKLVALADALLGRDGAMVEAIAAIGRGAECYEGEPFVFPLQEVEAGLF